MGITVVCGHINFVSPAPAKALFSLLQVSQKKPTHCIVMPYLIKRAAKYRLQLFLLGAAILALVLGVSLFQTTEKAEASNVDIAQGIFLSGPDGRPLDHENPDEIELNAGDTSVEFGVPSGGSVAVEVNGEAGTFTRDDTDLDVGIPNGEGAFLIRIVYTDDQGNECEWFIIVNRNKDPGPITKTKDGRIQDDNSLLDDPKAPVPSGCCSGSKSGCRDCEEKAKKSGTASPSGNTDEGGGDTTKKNRQPSLGAALRPSSQRTGP